LISAALLLFISVTSATVSFARDEVELFPTASQSHTAIEIIDRLSVMHYRALPIDDGLSAKLLNAYIDRLDPSKSYFLQADVEGFEQYRSKLDDLLKQGDLLAAFAIYNRYRLRASERLQANITLLESDFVFDFEASESLDVDTDNRHWMASNEEADAYWRKRIKDAMIRLLINDKDTEEARELLLKRYKNLLTQFSQRNSTDVFEAYINAFTHLYDPHTAYFAPKNSDNFKIQMSLSLEGIGAVLQHEDEHTKVVSVVPKGPADKQGILKPGDKITAVAQEGEDFVDVVGWRLDDVVERIRGPKGSTVRLEIIPAKSGSSTSVEISIVRDKIQLEEQAAQGYMIEPSSLQASKSKNLGHTEGRRLGVIEVPTFYMDFDAYQKGDPDFTSTSRDVRRLLDELLAQGAEGIILDLRNNGGGFLHEATLLTDLFIDQGPVVQVRHTKQRISRHQRSRNRAYYDGPLVVLINRLSASASEIFAGAIQDYGRGLVVGTQSFGKGTVQSTTNLNEGMVKLTESKFYRVSGASTQHRGVIPDVTLPALFDKADVGESTRETALPWDEINPVPHRKYNYSTSTAAVALQQLHQARLQQDPDLLHLTAELALAKAQRDNKILSLNLEERQRQKEDYEQALLNLENKRRISRNLAPLDDFAALSEDLEVVSEQDQDNAPPKPKTAQSAEDDPILYEAGQVLADYLRLYSSSQPAKLVNK
jgi:carboxyl-terminal processing protease